MCCDFSSILFVIYNNVILKDVSLHISFVSYFVSSFNLKKKGMFLSHLNFA